MSRSNMCEVLGYLEIENCLKKCFPTGIVNVGLTEKKIALPYISTFMACFFVCFEFEV